MFALDLFNTKYEKELKEGAVDNLEARRIDDLNMRMLELLDRAKEPAYKKNPAALAGLKKQFQKIKAERDSYFKINPATGMDPTGSLGTTKGKLDEQHDSPVASAITRRILMQRPDLLKQYGPELVGAAIDNVADYVGDVDEIGSSDVSGWVAQVERMLKENPPEAFAEGWKDEADDFTEWSNHVKEKLSKASPEQRLGLAKQLSQLEVKHFGSNIPNTFNRQTGKPQSGLGLTDTVRNALKYFNAEQTGIRQYYDQDLPPGTFGDKFGSVTIDGMENATPAELALMAKAVRAGADYAKAAGRIYRETGTITQRDLDKIRQGFEKNASQFAASVGAQMDYSNRPEEPTALGQASLDRRDRAVSESAGPGVDAKGRTQSQWLALVNAKFPKGGPVTVVKLLQAKMPDGPIIASLSNGKQIGWSKVEQAVAEGQDNPYGYRKGQTVKLDNGQQGRVIDIFDDSIEVLLVGGRTVTVDFRDAQVIGEQGMAEEKNPYGDYKQSPRAFGAGNFQRIVRANMGNLPSVTLEFPKPKDNINLDKKGLELISDYYDSLENDSLKNHFIYRVLPSADEILTVLKRLGWNQAVQPELPGIPTQGELPLQEKKKFDSNSDVTAGDTKVARELQKLRAQYPAAKSDVEAVAKSEIDSNERSQQQLSAIKGANTEQDRLLQQLIALDKKQGTEIGSLDNENDRLEQQLAYVEKTNAKLAQTIGQMSGQSQSSNTNTNQPGTIDLLPNAPADAPSPAQAQTQPTADAPAEPEQKFKSKSNAISQMAQSLSQSRRVQGINSGPAPSIRGNITDINQYRNDAVRRAQAAIADKNFKPLANQLVNKGVLQPTGTDESINEGQRLHRGDPVVVTAPNEFEGKTGEIYDFSPSGKFVIVDLYNHGKHSMHLSDVAYNDYADQEEENDWYDEGVAEGKKKKKKKSSKPMGGYFFPGYAYYGGGESGDGGGDGGGGESVNEFAPAGGGGKGGNYFQALASAWYNGAFNTGSLQKGIKSKEDVERLLQRGILCPDGVTRKYAIDYNAEFNGVVISSDDYYEHSDYNDKGQEVDSRTGKLWGPNDYMEFSDDDLSESQGVAEARPEDLPGIDYPRPGDTPRKQPSGKQNPYPYSREEDDDYFREIFRKKREAAAKAKGGSLNELSNEKLAQYKTAAALDAGAADKAGNYERGDKRFSGIVKATKKQFANDVKKHKDQGVAEGQTDYQKRRQRERDVDAGKPVARQPRNPQTDYAKKRAQDKKDMELGEGLMKEPTTRKEYLDQRDKLFRMMAVDSNPANKQIIKQALQDLEARYGNLKNAVKEESSTASEAVERAILNRIMVAHTDLLMKFGPDKVMQAAEEVAYNVGDVDEIGTSDVSAYVNQVKQILGA